MKAPSGWRKRVFPHDPRLARQPPERRFAQSASRRVPSGTPVFMPRVLISDKLESPGLDLLRQAGIELDERARPQGRRPQGRPCARPTASSSAAAPQITAELLENPGKLRAIVRAGVGVDNIDVAAATRKGIVVMNTPGGNTVSTAEQTITLLMALARHIPAADAHVRSAPASGSATSSSARQLAGKTLGIVGLGRIGREVARRAAGLDMKVIGFDPFLAPDRGRPARHRERRRTSTRCCRACDFLTVHTPLTDETRNLIGARELARMRRGARVINCARGGIYQRGGAGRGARDRATSPAPPSTSSCRSRRRPIIRC